MISVADARKGPAIGMRVAVQIVGITYAKIVEQAPDLSWFAVATDGTRYNFDSANWMKDVWPAEVQEPT